MNTKWYEILKEEFRSPYLHKVFDFIQEDAKLHRIYPDKHNVFKSLELTDYDKVKVVILGQDPYINEGQATGLAFAVPEDFYPKPPSLSNIVKELAIDLYEDGIASNALDIAMSLENTSLTGWADQGVLLLNTVLTVREKQTFSHKGIGWEQFTNKIIQKLNDRKDPIIFMLWGNSAKDKEKFITNKNHFVLTAAHPSPLSAHRGFFGCKHFSKANNILKQMDKSPIDWLRI